MFSSGDNLKTTTCLLYTISIMANAKEPTYEEKQEKQRGPHGEGGAGQLC